MTYLEELGPLDPLEQVVTAALLLDNVAGLVGLAYVSTRRFNIYIHRLVLSYQNTDLLVGVLPRNTVGGELHEDGLGSHCEGR